MTQSQIYLQTILILLMLFVGASHFQSSAMFPAGSIQSMSNGLGLVSAPFLISNVANNKNCLQRDLIHELHEAGIYDYAQSLGIIQNGVFVVQNGMNIDEKFSELWPATGAYSLPISSGAPATYPQFNPCPSVPLVSVDTGSNGSSSRGSDGAIARLASDNIMARLNHLDAEGDEFESPGTVGRKRRRIHRSSIGVTGGRGLRHFSMKVCKKVESKGWTTYNEVASELVAEFVNPNSTHFSQDQQQFDEKNIRRRVYDALNVLMAMDIISKEKKEIRWKGLPTTNLSDIEQLKTERKRLTSRIDKKRAYLQELKEQITGLQNLVLRNERVYGSGNSPSGGVTLPFILVKTRPHATVDIEISEDMQLVHFDFNSTPFELHDDAFVLKAMRFCKTPDSSGPVDEKSGNESVFDKKYSVLSTMPKGTSSSHSTRTSDTDSYSLSSIPGKICSSSPDPGIIKARIKSENFI